MKSGGGNPLKSCDYCHTVARIHPESRFCKPECRRAFNAEIRAENKRIAEAVKASRPVVRTYHAKCRFCQKWIVSSSSVVLNGRSVCKETACYNAQHLEAKRLQNGGTTDGVFLADADTSTCSGCGANYKTTNLHRIAFCPECAAEKDRYLRVWHEPVNRIKVFQRDKWTCQHCGVATPEWLRTVLGDCQPTLDHILPVSQGGAHSYFNTQLLCRKCNQDKGDDVTREPRLAGVTDLAPYRTAAYPPNGKRGRQQQPPTSCACGCGKEFIPYVTGNGQYAMGHWNRTPERRAALATSGGRYAEPIAGGWPSDKLEAECVAMKQRWIAKKHGSKPCDAVTS